MGLDRPIDITTDQRKTVLRLLASHLPNTTAWVYGSRVKWTARPESDLDLVVFAAPEQTGRGSNLREAFEESDLPFRVDLFVWDEVPEQFRKQIEAEHVVLVESEELGVASGWRRSTLDQLGRIVTGKTPPSKIQGSFGGDIPFVTPTDLDGRRVIVSTGRSLTRRGIEAVYNSRIPARSVMVSCIGSDMGKTAIAARECVTNQQINSIVVDSRDEPLFVYYNLSNRKAEIRASAGGSAQPILNKSGFGQFDILLPPLPEQRAIAHVLGKLDDKIELNRRMNQTLEEMARALFKSWFVDFDPVRAKTTLKHHASPPQGRSDWSVERARAYLDRMDPNIAALFPDRFVDSALGPIPEGWEMTELGELVELAYGKALKAENRKSGAIPVYGSNGQVGWHAKELVVGPGIVVGRKGNPGVVTWVQGDFFPIDTTFYVIPRNPISRLTFLFYALTHQDLQSVAADSAVPGLNRNLAYMNRQVVPPKLLADEFNDYASAIFTRSYHLEVESRTLADLRDTLLPNLISGKLGVKDAESFVAEIACP